MPALFGIALVPAAVPEDATFLDAAAMLTAHPVSAVAVLGAEDAVVGTFGAEQLLQGLFPRYLGELRHTAFAPDDPALLAGYAREASLHPVREFMSEPVTIEHDSSATHAAERFIHSDCDALPVVEHGRFVGMLGRSEFCRAMLDAAT